MKGLEMETEMELRWSEMTSREKMKAVMKVNRRSALAKEHLKE